jgi:predicted AAA+ superfamily ATPase
MACEIRGEVEGSINDLVLHDITIFKEFYDFDFTEMMEVLKAPELRTILFYESPSRDSKVYNKRIRDRICHLTQQFAENENALAMKNTLTEFYGEYGVGKFGLHKAFRVVHEESGAKIVPILNIAHVRLDDLVGYEIPKKKLTDNTEAFVSGRKANNCLLFGDAGTGKSSCIKAISNEYYDRGLRIIEIYKHQFQDLHAVISQIKNRNYKFIIYMDDLSFEDFEIEYKYLKAVIEGGLEKKPANVLIYATSNRRHLIRENYSDKEDRRAEDMHSGDTVQEKLSLVYRFGVTIYFGAPDKKQFQQIVKTLAERNGIAMDEEELYLEANKWELSHGGLSGRTAQQFIDYLGGKE